MNGLLEFHNFNENNEYVFADLYCNGEYVMGVFDYIERIRYYDYQDNVYSAFKKAAMIYLGDCKISPANDVI